MIWLKKFQVVLKGLGGPYPKSEFSIFVIQKLHEILNLKFDSNSIRTLFELYSISIRTQLCDLGLDFKNIFFYII